MITIKSSFSRCDVNELKNEYIKLLPDGFDIKSESAAFDTWFEKIMHIEPESCTDKILIPYTAHYSMGYAENVYMDVGYVMKKELRGMIPVPDSTVLKDSTAASRLKEVLDSVSVPEVYAFEFRSWKEVLGFSVPERLLSRFGLEKVMACVANELTFFGYEEEDAGKEKEILEKAILKCKDEDMEAGAGNKVSGESGRWKALDMKEAASVCIKNAEDAEEMEKRNRKIYRNQIATKINKIHSLNSIYEELCASGSAECGNLLENTQGMGDIFLNSSDDVDVPALALNEKPDGVLEAAACFAV